MSIYLLTQKGTPGGPDPGRLVNPEYISKSSIDLSSVPELEPSQMLSSRVGELFRFSTRALKAFEKFEVPHSVRSDWKPTPVPTTTLRKASVELVSKLERASEEEPSSQKCLLALNGAAGSGKSTVLLHGVSYAVQKRWIVLYIPDVQPLVGGRYGYEYCSKSQIFHQNSLSSTILSRLLSLNDLSGLIVKNSKELFGTRDEQFVEAQDPPISTGLPLTSLIQMGIQNPHFGPVVLDAVLEELSQQTVRPVLLAIDGAQNLFKTSGYLDGSFRPIDSFALNVPRLLVSFARGTRKMSKGLTVLSASSLDTTSKSVAWESVIKGGKLPSGYIWPGWGAYGELAKPISDIPKIEVENLELREAAGVARGLEITKQLFGPLSDRIFARHFVSSGGNAREFRREIKHQLAF
ncbi:mitochondrial ribosomal death-associated protein 3-domain-containing protein [Phakopsora pachyrhizi]|nr:mitochondrial ribosomal death-associated protein 3-domain-containing protein [Phakopsora pachyrhizi]